MPDDSLSNTAELISSIQDYLNDMDVNCYPADPQDTVLAIQYIDPETFCMRQFYPVSVPKEFLQDNTPTDFQKIQYQEKHRFFLTRSKQNLDIRQEVWIEDLQKWIPKEDLKLLYPPNTKSAEWYASDIFSAYLPDLFHSENIPCVPYLVSLNIEDAPFRDPVFHAVFSILENTMACYEFIYGYFSVDDMASMLTNHIQMILYELLYQAGYQELADNILSDWINLGFREQMYYEVDDPNEYIICNLLEDFWMFRSKKKLHQKLNLKQEELQLFTDDKIHEIYANNKIGQYDIVFGQEDVRPMLMVLHLMMMLHLHFPELQWMNTEKLINYLFQFKRYDLDDVIDHLKSSIHSCLKQEGIGVKDSYTPQEIRRIKSIPLSRLLPNGFNDPNSSIAYSCLAPVKNLQRIIKWTPTDQYDQQLHELAEIYEKRYGYENNLYAVCFPHSNQDLVEAGEHLTICVGHGYYLHKMLNRQSLIGFIKRKSDQNIICCLEIHDNEILQARIKENHSPDPSLQNFLNEYKLAVLDSIDLNDLKNSLQKHPALKQKLQLYKAVSKPYNRKSRDHLFEDWTSDLNKALQDKKAGYVYTIEVDESMLSAGKTNVNNGHLLYQYDWKHTNDPSAYVLNLSSEQYKNLPVRLYEQNPAVFLTA